MKTIKQLGQEMAGLKARKVKVDKGTRLTVRDKQCRQSMPKARNAANRRGVTLDELSNLIMDIIKRTERLSQGKAPELIADLWVCYAGLQAFHIDDDHYSVTDIPVPCWMTRQDKKAKLPKGIKLGWSWSEDEYQATLEH
jgi:hypothetical protein